MVAAAIFLLLAASARGAPPVPARLLQALERDVGGALAQLETLRAAPPEDGGAEAPATLLGIADGSAEAAMATMATTIRALRRRLITLDTAVRKLGDPRLAQIVFIMKGELDRLAGALAHARNAPDRKTRQEALARLEYGLVQLDGATAALWTFD